MENFLKGNKMKIIAKNLKMIFRIEMEMIDIFESLTDILLINFHSFSVYAILICKFVPGVFNSQVHNCLEHIFKVGHCYTQLHLSIIPSTGGRVELLNY